MSLLVQLTFHSPTLLEGEGEHDGDDSSKKQKKTLLQNWHSIFDHVNRCLDACELEEAEAEKQHGVGSVLRDLKNTY